MQRIKAWLPAAVWMVVIFLMSAMPGDASGNASGSLVSLLLGAISLLLGESAAAGISPDMLHLLIRKGAHMAEYAVLFFLDHRALRMEDTKHPGPYALILCALYAVTDEWHQSFVAGRGPSLIDVGIDTLGAGIGWAFVTYLRHKKMKEER